MYTAEIPQFTEQGVAGGRAGKGASVGFEPVVTPAAVSHEGHFQVAGVLHLFYDDSFDALLFFRYDREIEFGRIIFERSPSALKRR